MEIKFKFLVIQCSLPEFVMKDHKGLLLGYQMTKKFENLHSPKTAYRCEKKKKTKNFENDRKTISKFGHSSLKFR